MDRDATHHRGGSLTRPPSRRTRCRPFAALPPPPARRRPPSANTTHAQVELAARAGEAEYAVALTTESGGSEAQIAAVQASRPHAAARVCVCVCSVFLDAPVPWSGGVGVASSRRRHHKTCVASSRARARPQGHGSFAGGMQVDASTLDMLWRSVSSPHRALPEIDSHMVRRRRATSRRRAYVRSPLPLRRPRRLSAVRRRSRAQRDARARLSAVLRVA